ncbi:MAG: hypothetical protein ACTH6H_15885, partial [Serratia sp. (in: enterobacteria)]
MRGEKDLSGRRGSSVPQRCLQGTKSARQHPGSQLESFMTELTAAAQRALTLMDLTTLNDDDT